MDDETRMMARLQNGVGRRGALTRLGLGAAAAGLLATGGARTARADTPPTDFDILNFALNLEYLEAEYYQRAVFGHGIPKQYTTGTGVQGTVTGGRKVTFTTPRIKQIAQEIAQDELNHVIFLRSVLGDQAVAEPSIDIMNSFLQLGQLAGLPQPFDPYVDETSFLLGGFVFEDVGVTAYNGAAPSITDKTILGAAASILGVEAYHAAELRYLCLTMGLGNATNAIAAVRASASGTGPGTPYPADDQGTKLDNGHANIVPTDTNSLVFARTPQQVLSVVYLEGTSGGGFFPDGVNGTINMA
jgi:hypothetical protein